MQSRPFWKKLYQVTSVIVCIAMLFQASPAAASPAARRYSHLPAPGVSPGSRAAPVQATSPDLAPTQAVAGPPPSSFAVAGVTGQGAGRAPDVTPLTVRSLSSSITSSTLASAGNRRPATSPVVLPPALGNESASDIGLADPSLSAPKSMGSAAPAGVCGLYPIALSQASLAGVAPGQEIGDILNGTGPGNFGWLTWAGRPAEPVLVTSLTPPGDSKTYVNPNNPADHQVNIGDWVRGRPGVSDSAAVRAALDVLETLDITVPVWDQSSGQGSSARYRAVGFVLVRLTAYQLPAQNSISARYLGYDHSCPGQRLPVVADDEYQVNEDETLVVPAPGVLSNDSDPDGDFLTAQVTSDPSHGTLVFSPAGSFTYTPGPDYNGADSFTYIANDGRFDSSPATVHITVLPVNDAPVAANDAYSTDEDTPLTVAAPGVLVNDTDVDGDALSAALVAGPAHGTLQLAAGGSFVYTPALDYNGPDGFTYVANDGNLNSALTTVTITVNPVADPPAAMDDAYNATAGTPLVVPAPGILANDGDPDGDAITAVLQSGPAHGALALNPDGSFTYTSAAGFGGVDTFTYKASDGQSLSNLATVRITVEVVGICRTYTNDADFDEGRSINVLHSVPNQLQLDDTTRAFAFIWVAVSTKGTIVKIDTETGQVLGEYRTAPQGQPLDPSRTTIDLNGNVWNTNRAGHSVVQVGLKENGQCIDRNGNGVIDTSTGLNDIKAWPNTGGLDTNGGVRTAQDECILKYVLVNSWGTRHLAVTPENNIWVSGTGSRVFQLTDGATGAILRTEGPVGYGGYGGLIDPNGVIWSSNPLLRWDTSKPLSGSNGGNWKGWGHDSYGLCIDSHGNVWNTSLYGNQIRKFAPDGTLLGTYGHGYNSAQGCVVDGNDDVWVAHVLWGSPTVGHLKNNGQFVGNVPVASGPTGVAVDAAGKIWATNYNTRNVQRINPNAGPIGADGVTHVGAVDFTSVDLGGNLYNYSDMTGSTLTGAPDAGTWAVTFDSQMPGAEWGTLDWADAIFGNGALGVTAASSDDGTTFGSPVPATNAADLTLPNGRYLRVSVNFTRAGSGESPILYDLTACTAGAAAANQRPAAAADAYSVTEDQALQAPAPGVLGNDTDADGNPLAAALVTPAAHGGLTLNADGSFSYAPAPNFNGADSFTYRATDGTLDSGVVSVSITVTPVDDPPAAIDDSVTTAEDAAVTINVASNDTDPDANLDPASAQTTSDPAHGALVNNGNGSFQYTPAANYNGFDSFTYRVCDTTGLCDAAAVNITITSVNDPPVANDDVATTAEDMGVTIDVVANDSDVDGNLSRASAQATSAPAHGALVDNGNGSFDYNPSSDYNGADSFTYQVCDTVGACDTATVSITITPVNDAPLAVGDGYTVQMEQVLSVPAPGLLGNDVEVDGDALTAVVDAAPAHGNLALNADGSFSYTPAAGFSGADIFTYHASDGALSSNIAMVTVQVYEVNNPPVANDDVAATAEDTAATINVVANDTDPDGNLDPASAQATSSPAHGVLANNGSGSFAYTPAANYNGADGFTYRVCDTAGACDTASVSITVTPVNDPPVASDDTATITEDGGLVIYVVSNDADVDGNLNAASAQATSSPAHGVLVNNGSGSFQYTPAPNYNGADSFTYQVCDAAGACDAATVHITVTPVNDAPLALNDGYNVPADQPLNVPATGVLGNDGDVDGNPLTAALDATTHHGALALNADGSFSYMPAGGFTGADSFTYHANDGALDSNIATVTILVNVANNPPVAAGDTATTAEDTVVTIDVVANDADPDGNLDPASAQATSGPAHGALANNGNGSFRYTPALNYNGADSFTYRVCDAGGACASAAVDITTTPVNDAPAAVNDTYTVYSDQALSVPAPGVLGNDADVDGNPLTVALDVTTAHGVLALNADGSFSYTPAAGFIGADAFTYHAGDGTLDSNTATVSIGVALAPPAVSISGPAEGEKVTAQTAVVGTVNSAALASWELAYRLAGDAVFTPFAIGTTPVANAALGTFDPTLLLNGLYEIRLTATDAIGQSSAVSVDVVTEGEQKVGNFTVSFTDLEVPVAGIPIQVVRTYDSRDKRTGDFGVGWTLDVKTTRLQENGITGENWESRNRGFIFPLFCIEPTKAHIVTITLPDGSVYKFEPAVSGCQVLPLPWVSVVYSPLPGTTGSLVPLDGGAVYANGGWPGPIELLDLNTFMPYDPDLYQLTTQDGRVFVIDQHAGLRSMTDPNGNTLTIGAGGILHSSGKSVVFTRDAQNRITRITDPAGNSINYAYSGAGNLAGVTDRVGGLTRYTYNSSHGLVDIIDPRGVRAIRNEYDADGRLTAHIDADGNRIEYTHDLSARQETVTDRLGNPTVYAYDVDGNVTSTTDALGHTRTYTYDARGNKLSETDPLGNTSSFTYDAQDHLLTQTDAAGHVTSYTYNARGQVLTVTDPAGKTTTSTYDSRGNLETTTDPLGNTTTYAYDAAGNLASTTDPLGHTTTYTNDANGNRTGETDALGNVTTYTYDANGNLLVTTTTRTDLAGNTFTVVTTNQYDAANRVVRSVDAEGHAARVEYNAVGQKTADIDRNGNRTQYEYDARGNRVRTLFADGTEETATYDANGSRLTFTNRAGQTTQYVYDHLNRPVRVINPGGSATAKEYDAAGNLAAAIDENGNRTAYGYDAAGYNTTVTDAAGHVTTYAYRTDVYAADEADVASITDANGHTTSFEYDELGRRTKITYPDNTSATATYDAVGRKLTETDQAGNTTQFAYDALGRLTSVTDALGHTWAYTYDRLGNKLTQTDANGHVTQWSYNNLGLVTGRTLPLGMAESFAYDANGNVISATDFDGRTTTSAYDSNNRLILKTYADGTHVGYTYTPTGKRQTVTDSRGVTTYAYDARDRLTGITNPNGATLAYSYDAAGNRTAVVTPSGTTTSAYDALNRLSSVTAPDGGVTTYGYDAVGNRTSVAYPNNTVAAYTYDALNRLVYLENSKLPAVLISSYTYTLGPAGNRLSVVEHGGRTVNYTYDALYRLTKEAIADPAAGNKTIDYTYDAVGNRLTKTDGAATTTYTYDANDRLTGETGGSYTYDANGNTLTRTKADGTTDYAYDFENRLVSVQQGGGAVTYGYDADGNRVHSVVNGAVTDYLVDPNRDYAQVLEERDGAGALVVGYVYGDDLISQSRGGTVSYYHYDGLGSTRALTDGAADTTDTYSYDAFGLLMASTGSTPNNYRFTGEQYDPNIGFYYLRARYYAPDLGRFLTADLFPGVMFDPLTLHKYLYANANPVNRIDPGGKMAFIEMAMISALIGILAGLITYAFTQNLKTALLVGVGAFLLTFLALGLFGAVGWGGAAGAGGAGLPTLPRLLNPATWQQAQTMLGQALGLAQNWTRFFVQGMSRARIPDFVGPNFIADSKFVQTLTTTAQIRDFVVLAQSMNVPLYIFVRVNTYVTAPVLQLIQSTGGNVIRIFQ